MAADSFYNNMRPQLYIEVDAWKKISGYTKIASPDEIGGIAECVIDERGEFVIKDAFIVDQTIKGSECELSAEGLANFLMEWHTQGRDVSTLRCWWHSHANMSTFWSGTDQEAILGWPSDMVVALVVNTKGDMEACLAVREPYPLVVQMVPQVDMRIHNYKSLEEEVKTYCKKIGYATVQKGTGYSGSPFMGNAGQTGKEISTIVKGNQSTSATDSVTKLTPGGTDNQAGKKWPDTVKSNVEIEQGLQECTTPEEFYTFLTQYDKLDKCYLVGYCPSVSCTNQPDGKCRMHPSVRRNIARRLYEAEFVAFGWKVGGKSCIGTEVDADELRVQFEKGHFDGITFEMNDDPLNQTTATVSGDIDDDIIQSLKEMGVIVIDERKTE